MDLDDIFDIGDLVVDFVKGHWKPLLVFLVLVILGIASILYQTIDTLEETEKEVRDNVVSDVMDTFEQVGEDTSETISDPGLKVVIKLLWIMFGVCILLMIFIPIGKMFKDLATALNPVNIAKNFK